MIAKDIERCERCGEDALLVTLNREQCFVRVRRMSFCKDYKAGEYNSCKTPILSTPRGAINFWNAGYGHQEERKNEKTS